MKKGWHEVPLGEVLQDSERFEAPQPGVEYRQLGVRLWGEGAYEREIIDGANTQYAFFNRCESGDLVLNKIWARNGSVSIVPPSLAGCYVSTEFPLYRATSAVIPGWLRLITKSRWFWTACDEKARGSSGKNRIKPSQFLGIQIPLPPMAEQQRIVAHLDAIEACLSRAQKLREESALESRALIRSLMDTQHCAGVKPVPMHELVTWRSPDVAVSQSESYTFAGVYSFGRGVFRKEAVSGMDFAYDRLTRLRAGEFTFPKLMAWEGALGIVPPDCDGCHVSPEFPVFTVDESKVLPEILDIHFKTPAVWKDLAAISTGTNLRRRRLNPNAFLGYQFPLPPMEVQQHVKAIADRAATKHTLQIDAGIMEKALLPSLLDRIFNS